MGHSHRMLEAKRRGHKYGAEYQVLHKSNRGNVHIFVPHDITDKREQMAFAKAAQAEIIRREEELDSQGDFIIFNGKNDMQFKHLLFTPREHEKPVSLQTQPEGNKMEQKPWEATATQTTTPPAKDLPAMPEPPARQKIVRRVLTHAQFYKLCTHIRSLNNLSGYENAIALAEACEKKLGFQVADSTVLEAMDATGVDNPWKRRRQPRLDDCATVARALVELMIELGKIPPAALLEIAE